MLLAVDPHSPAEHRANVVRNIDAFHEAFGVGEGDGMWLDPADRVSVF
jgi:putative endopeptidase